MMFTLEAVQKFHNWTHASLTLLLDHLSTMPFGDYVKELPDFGAPYVARTDHSYFQL